jgi:hypothetical protein
MDEQMREVCVAEKTSLSGPGRGWKIILKLSLNRLDLIFTFVPCIVILSQFFIRQRMHK